MRSSSSFGSTRIHLIKCLFSLSVRPSVRHSFGYMIFGIWGRIQDTSCKEICAWLVIQLKQRLDGSGRILIVPDLLGRARGSRAMWYFHEWHTRPKHHFRTKYLSLYGSDLGSDLYFFIAFFWSCGLAIKDHLRRQTSLLLAIWDRPLLSRLVPPLGLISMGIGVWILIAIKWIKNKRNPILNMNI